ncbi:deoxyribose-phosphate aldolase [Aerococcus sanguinicola]|uniref:deoxyribose-phosphate aldolase n=1 Tax=Aerococcus sanguinicola TaxID=119206 RepID=UPI0018A75992|nr:deoxyribose-phosphate aldolase [Aerococcus sanguinicola]
MAEYTLDQLFRLIDHTNLKADASSEAITQLCEEAKKYHFKMVAINQTQSKLCAKVLSGTDINVGAAIAFPLGQTSIAAKYFETQDAIANGANEIDYVINITELKDKNYAYIQEEMEKIVEICRDANVVSKVIFENCYLSKDEIKKVAEIAKEVKPDFIKTSTGFGTSGATVEDVQLMKETVGDAVKVKAAGGIRDADTFLAMINAGAERIGCSSGISIIKELKERMEREKIDKFVI